MKIFPLVLFFFFFGKFGVAQDHIHSEMIDLVNFVRQEPQRFLEEVALPYIEENELGKSSYSKSLIRTLKNQAPLPPLNENSNLSNMAIEYSVEAGKRGWTDHVRTTARFKKYAPELDNTAENLQFGSEDALSAVMDLLIDEDVKSLGHRMNILDNQFTEIGVAFGTHKTYGTIGVMVFGGFD